ncbi:MAG: metalloregulator ArsR/SmtB family transcription factor [Proteobacteria bacterium]|nr:winged helix-turn-helix transcriptional regulator [Desulfobulbaceae bacterium]MBU4154263.1 metalloregulator ArsR/SmtB family transcription factor [Pseudomonadota bacterium]
MNDETESTWRKETDFLSQNVGDLSTVAFLAKTLADENRLRILLALSTGKKSVSVVVGELSLSQPLVSHHLKELRRALLVKVERSGPFVYYELSDPRILDIMEGLCHLGQELLATQTIFK